MKLLWGLTVLTSLVAAQNEAGRTPTAPRPAGSPQPAAGLPQPVAGSPVPAENATAGQDLRFSPALIGAAINAGSQILGFGGQHGQQFHEHGGFRPQRPFGARPSRPGLGGFGQGGFGQGGFGQGGFGQGGFGQGGFGQGGFGHGGFGQSGGFGQAAGFGQGAGLGHGGGFGQGGFGQGGFGQAGFGQGGVGLGGFNQNAFGNEKGGLCPPVRSDCPVRSHIGAPTVCQNDFQCAAAAKCCFDTCLNHQVCKQPL